MFTDERLTWKSNWSAKLEMIIRVASTGKSRTYTPETDFTLLATSCRFYFINELYELTTKQITISHKKQLHNVEEAVFL